MRSLNPALLDHVRQADRRTPRRRARRGEHDRPSDTTLEFVDAYVVCALAPSTVGTVVSFAREGGTLAILPTWDSRDVVEAVVALHHGKLVFADNEQRTAARPRHTKPSQHTRRLPR